ncbi:MAG TPA: HK97 family phage prohead protease [Mesorhizobium sp.]|jgi:HK97 family phage prohead protease|uniref:HK97 family phage prohead protease n=1 Tax=Mesorhizobium sp. TaxID=1871066 RepID=UPI002DDD85E4|nr:HK97 family phage prohead protease [Mesorhizobium sp.]HEV2502340.1 HK97 family phage prohead protease [Mesorhizobium sp.]
MKARNFAFDALKTCDFALDTKSISDQGEFEGYASTFGNVDEGGDLVEPGAFIESVVKAKKDGRNIPMLWQHDRDEPIGVWKDIAEDSKGLYVKGQLILEGDPVAQRAYGKLKAKALGGLSIGYRLLPGAVEPDEKRPGVTRLKKVDLREISLVTMPMNIEARITSVKSLLDDGKLPTVREFEEFLRDAGGFSKSLAAAIAGKAAPHLRGEPEATAKTARRFLEALRAN